MKKKILLTILSGIWVAILIALGVYFAVFTEKESTFDSDENRMLAAAPNFSIRNIWNGDISTETENFLSDHSFGRKNAIKFCNNLRNMVSAASYKDSLAIMDKKDAALSSDDLSEVDLDEMAKQLEEETEPVHTHREKPPASADDYADSLYVKLYVEDDVIYYYEYGKTNVLAMISVLNRIASFLPEDRKSTL